MTKLRKFVTGEEVMKRLDISILDLKELTRSGGPLQAYDPSTGLKVNFNLEFVNGHLVIVDTRPGLKLEESCFPVFQVEIIEKAQQKSKPRNQDKWNAVMIKAAELWKSDPNITISAMAKRDEITEIIGQNYSEKTLRKHINDLCPNRSPGRRPSKK